MTTGIKAVETFLDVMAANNRQPPTDVTVVVGRETFECHRSVLDSWSQYFRAVFTSPMSEQEANKVRIEEGDYVTAESFQLILTYMYSGKIEISEENLIGILRTAHYLQMTKIVELCKEFIEENNALSISRRVVLHVVNLDFPDLHDVQNSAMNHLTRHLSEYIINEEFVDLNRVLLHRILEKEEVGALDEDQIFMAVLEWLLKNEDRYQYGDSLLSKVRLGCVSAAKLRLVRQHDGLLLHLTTVEPIIMDMVVSSVLEENEIGECIPFGPTDPCKRNPEMYRKRKYLAPEHLERLVPVYLQPEGDAYYWDKGGWVQGKLGLENCVTNIAIGDQTLYYISKSDCLMSRSMHSQKWTLVSRLPGMTLARNPSGWSRHFLVCLGSYVYILSTGMSMQYDIKNKTLHLFDTMLTKWDYITQAAAVYSTSDPQRPVIVIAGSQFMYEDEHCSLLAIGDPHHGWTEVTATWLDGEEDWYSGTIGFTVSEEDNSILAVTSEPAVYCVSLSDLPHDVTGKLPEWKEVPTSSIGGVSLVTCTRNKYSIFKDILLPFPSKSHVLNIEDLRYNPQFVGDHGPPGRQRDPARWWRSNLMLLPIGFINVV